MDTQDRRSLLVTAPNPNPRLDYVSALEGTVALSTTGDVATVSLFYVPDKLILDTVSFGFYLKAFETMAWESLEQVAVTILDDVGNEAVARWVQVALSGPDPAHGNVGRHAVLVQDRQPGWDNPALLSRLRRF
jgi:7-cyano-7-deazaguanine reductase